MAKEKKVVDTHSDYVREIKAKIVACEKQGGQENEIAGLKAIIGE